MKKVLLSNMITLDGFFAGPSGDIDWHVTDEEFDQFAVEQLQETDTLLFGRVTYELMASYWPTDEAKANEPRVAKAMNEQSKKHIKTWTFNSGNVLLCYEPAG